VRLEKLQDQEIRDGQTSVDRSNRTDRPIRIVRRDGHVISVGHRRDLLELRDAAGASDVGLNNAHGLPFQQFAETVAAEDALARG
jgi:hypothetical protein